MKVLGDITHIAECACALDATVGHCDFNLCEPFDRRAQQESVHQSTGSASAGAPDESQPKPLRPGSAQARLADALGVPERKLPE